MLDEPCPFCGHEMDINDDVCPGCGRPRRLKRERRASGMNAATCILTAMAAGGVLGWLSGLASAWGFGGSEEIVMSVAVVLGIFFGLLVGIYLYRRQSRLQ